MKWFFFVLFMVFFASDNPFWIVMLVLFLMTEE
jgi:hypothetical protein